MEKREAGRLLCDFISGKKTAAANLGKLSPADWESLADRALRFKVEALFHRELKSRGFPAEFVPLAVSDRLRKAYRDRATRNTVLFFDATEVLKSLADQQLPVIALKGLALAKDIYGDMALRPMFDLDLLLKKEDLLRAGRILLALGYQQDFPAWESMVKTYHHLPPFKNKNGSIMELHWNIVTPDSPIQVDIDGLWARARLLHEDQPIAVQVLSPEDLFLHLCVHACFHLQTVLDLIPFCDMAGLIKKYAAELDWQIIIARSARWGCQKCVYLMMLLLRELLGVAPPDKIMSKMEPGDYRPAFFEEALEQIINERSSGQLTRRRIGKLAKIIKVEGIGGKVWAFLNEVFPSRAYMARIYPVSVSSAKMYLYYLLRMGRLTVYYVKVFLRVFRHDQAVEQAIDQESRVSAVSDWMFSK